MDAAADDVAQRGPYLRRATARGRRCGSRRGVWRSGWRRRSGSGRSRRRGRQRRATRIAASGSSARGCLVEDRLERAVEQRGDQRGRGVVAAGRLALGAGGLVEREGRGGAVERRVQLEQRFVDRAELLGAEVAEVDGAADALVDGRERADRGEQVVVGELGDRRAARSPRATRGSCRARAARAAGSRRCRARPSRA